MPLERKDTSGVEALKNGAPCPENSTTTPLGIDGVFTGESIDIKGCGIVFVNVYSDQASATNGLSIQQSSDGTNWDHTDDYTIPAANGKNFSINPHANYLRVVYTNGGVEQTAFRLQTMCKFGDAKASSHRIKDTIIGDDDCVLVKAALTGENGNGDWHNVKTTKDGYLTISDNSNGLAIAKGEVTGHSSVQKFGNAPDFDQADGIITVWDGAEDGAAWELMDYTYSSIADIDSISSSDNADTVDITIQGLDSNWEEVEQTITLQGRTRVALSTSLIRVYRAYNNSSTNLAGHVVIYVNTALTNGVPTDKTKIRAIIDQVNQQTEMAVYTIPAGKTGYLTRGYASTAGASKSSNYVIRFYARKFGKVFRLQNINAISDTSTGIVILDYFIPLKIEEKTDLEVRVEATASGATGCSVSAGFDLVLVDNQ